MSQPRRFTVRDLMIVVAALALSFWLMPIEFPFFQSELQDLAQQSLVRAAARFVRRTLNGQPSGVRNLTIQPMVAIWTLTVLLLELLHFRPPLRRVARQPGFAACCAVAMAIALVGSMNFALTYNNYSPAAPLGVRVHDTLVSVLAFGHGQCGAAVAAVWLTLTLTCGWRPRPDWLDRAGRILGIFWIAIVPLTWIEAILWS